MDCMALIKRREAWQCGSGKIFALLKVQIVGFKGEMYGKNCMV